MAGHSVTIQGEEFSLLFTQDDIARRIQALGKEIAASLSGKDLVYIGVLNGAFMFFSDLVKAIGLDAPVHFVKVASYHGMESSGRVRELVGYTGDIKGKDVLLIDDILDTGHTYHYLIGSLQAKEPRSIHFACLLHKPSATQVADAKPDYVAFTIENHFVVGFGLDYNQAGRTFTNLYYKS
ncbi:MAG: hypoxanthine phosphoribosyltransferase [Bacteroidetes bacterium]|jgi:hypoxanthine phosphoribosyltransferase|nr:hypoxanthine phosphoribosyltransferase [Bacteroidota bacterium]